MHNLIAKREVETVLSCSRPPTSSAEGVLLGGRRLEHLESYRDVLVNFLRKVGTVALVSVLETVTSGVYGLRALL